MAMNNSPMSGTKLFLIAAGVTALLIGGEVIRVMYFTDKRIDPLEKQVARKLEREKSGSFDGQFVLQEGGGGLMGGGARGGAFAPGGDGPRFGGVTASPLPPPGTPAQSGGTFTPTTRLNSAGTGNYGLGSRINPPAAAPVDPNKLSDLPGFEGGTTKPAAPTGLTPLTPNAPLPGSTSMKLDNGRQVFFTADKDVFVLRPNGEIVKLPDGVYRLQDGRDLIIGNGKGRVVE